jgi:hypothetical protein
LLTESGAVVPVDKLSASNRRVLISAAKKLLEGVGEIPSAVEQMELAIHYRRTMSYAEIALLPLSWCEVPAIDEAGNGLLIEKDT